MDPTLKVGLAVLSALLFSLWVGWLTDKRLSRRDAARAQTAHHCLVGVPGRSRTLEDVREAPAGSIVLVHRRNDPLYPLIFRRGPGELLLRCVPAPYASHPVRVDELDPVNFTISIPWEPKP